MEHLTGVAYLLGKLVKRGNGLAFEPTSGGRFDTGPDFYAPQLVAFPNRVLVWGWSWEGSRRTPEQIEVSGYNGSLTFPREVKVEDQQVSLLSVKELDVLRVEPVDINNDINGESIEINFKAEPNVSNDSTLSLIDKETNTSVFTTKAQEGIIYIDGSLIGILPLGEVGHTVRNYGENGLRVEYSGMIISAWRLAAKWQNQCPTALKPIG